MSREVILKAYTRKYGLVGSRSEMISPNLLEIERSIRALSVEEQLWLLERITRQVRERTQTKDKFADTKYMQEQLAAMAKDLHIQTEIMAINAEFAVTEMDGIEDL